MPLRFPLLLKKRGSRRTGSQRWARVGEILYQLMFVVAGLVIAWWIFYDVLIPEWRLIRSAANFEQAKCVVIDTRVSERPGLAEREYCPELQIQFEPTDGELVSVWTRHGVGRDGPSFQEAEQAVARFEKGEERDCWFDPKQPSNPDRVLISVQGSWLPYLVLTMPISLIIAGVIGLIRTLVSTRTSPERRSSMLNKGVDLQMLEVLPTRPTVASALPPSDTIDESPGVQLAYRLPMDGAQGMRIMGMAIVCALWNALAGLFVYHLAASYFPVGGSVGLAAIAVAPLAAIGGWLTYSLWRDARSIGGVGVTRLEISEHPLQPGATCRGVMLQSGSLRARALTISLVCEEVATYRQGTDSRTATVEVYRERLLQERSVTVEPGEPFSREFDIRVTDEGPISFSSPHNEVLWSIEVAVGSPRRPDLKRSYRICVYPKDWPVDQALLARMRSQSIDSKQAKVVV